MRIHNRTFWKVASGGAPVKANQGDEPMLTGLYQGASRRLKPIQASNNLRTGLIPSLLRCAALAVHVHDGIERAAHDPRPGGRGIGLVLGVLGLFQRAFQHLDRGRGTARELVENLVSRAFVDAVAAEMVAVVVDDRPAGDGFPRSRG